MRSKKETILIIENDIMMRTALAEYLRHCGYCVIEATNEKEAMQVLTESTFKVDILFSAIPVFRAVQWVRKHRPKIQVVLAGNTVKAAHAAGDLCEKGPHLKKPYEPQQVIEWIKRMQATQRGGKKNVIGIKRRVALVLEK